MNTLEENNEKRIYSHLSGFAPDYPGRQHTRQLGESFELQGPHGKHDVFVMEALGMSLRTLQEQQKPQVFAKDLVVSALDQVMRGVLFLHEVDVVHTGEQSSSFHNSVRPR